MSKNWLLMHISHIPFSLFPAVAKAVLKVTKKLCTAVATDQNIKVLCSD